jgi:protein SCO1/2
VSKNAFWWTLQSVSIAAILVSAGSIKTAAQTQGPPQYLRNVGIEQKLDQQVPLELQFHDETGQTVALQRYFEQKPVIVALVYYECPMLCTQVLNGLLASLRGLNLDIGKDFEVVTVSINPKETSALALQKKRVYTGLYGRPASADGWHFLTGDEPSIAALAQAVGFRYTYDPGTQQFAHATGIMVLTPEGKVSRYLYGIEFPLRDLRLALVEASAHKIGTPTDQVLLFCYHYDPTTGKYGLVVQNVIRIAGAVTVVLVGLLLLLLFKGERRAAA